MSKEIKNRHIRKYLLIIVSLLTIIVAFSIGFVFFVFYYGKVLPNVYVNSLLIGGLNKESALASLKSEYQIPEIIEVQISHGGSKSSFAIPTTAIDAAIDYDSTVHEAYNIGRSGSKRQDLEDTLAVLNTKKTINLRLSYNEQKLDEQASVIASQIPNQPKEPTIIATAGSVDVSNGEAGYLVDIPSLKENIIMTLSNTEDKVNMAASFKDPRLEEITKIEILEKARALLDKEIELVSEDNSFIYSGNELLDFLKASGGYRFDTATPSIDEIADIINRPPQNPVFKYENNRVQEFSPAKNGLLLDKSSLENKIAETLDKLLTGDVDSIQVEIPLTRTPPEFSTADVNDLGINELIGVGTSSYKGSISSRVFNVSHAASKLNGVLIKPGETFSFVNTLGDISALTGYKQAYIIQGNQTVLGDGGGVCQVSTTFFRAALDAGLPIVERHPHSYRVSYYEQDSEPGIDATIFHPTVDIKIKNDTPGHILIQTIADTNNMTLRFELYGTSDGRVATIGKPVVSSVTPPPEDLFIDDPTLPAGETKQIDYKAWGARVYFDYKVERDGEVIFEDTYYSNYRPWQAKFLRGTGPAV